MEDVGQRHGLLRLQALAVLAGRLAKVLSARRHERNRGANMGSLLETSKSFSQLFYVLAIKEIVHCM